MEEECSQQHLLARGILYLEKKGKSAKTNIQRRLEIFYTSSQIMERLVAPMTTTGQCCYMCYREVAYGHSCNDCKQVVCTFPSCSTFHEEDDSRPFYICKNCADQDPEDALPSATSLNACDISDINKSKEANVPSVSQKTALVNKEGKQYHKQVKPAGASKADANKCNNDDQRVESAEAAPKQPTATAAAHQVTMAFEMHRATDAIDDCSGMNYKSTEKEKHQSKVARRTALMVFGKKGQREKKKRQIEISDVNVKKFLSIFNLFTIIYIFFNLRLKFWLT
ncbi:PREDICTED: uncharacterized protein LOC107347344 isoform X2 [Acropora digitifera]|uniref:uncharacterized protein LOC107347344 isoform X2 n=1 Tax=Acropora digitifera TaxID=70779 RepID=UPI00077A8780|nr:PREDICTED: uncharacterized protein LOC107347344 isoform X2 [Acropora digitifera]